MTIEKYIVWRRNDGEIGMSSNYIPAPVAGRTFEEIARYPGFIGAWDRVNKERTPKNPNG